MQYLYAIADESDLADLEAALVGAFSEFVRHWPVEGVRITNRKAPVMEGQEIPDWNIGLGVEDPQLNRSDVEQLLEFLCRMSREMNLRFVVGLSRREWKESTRDACFVYRSFPDGAVGTILERLNAP